jgi:hypothetical protein
VNVETFAERVLRRPLWPHQVDAANADRFITCIAKARRTGGTVLAEVLATYTAFANAGCKVLVLSATQDAARRVTEGIGEMLARQPETRGALVDAYAARITLRNGSTIISLPASAKQIRGYGEGVLLVILDEASFMPAELWTAASYTALDERANGSRIVMLGTPFGGAEHFFRRAFLAGVDADPDHAAFHWTHKVNPKLDHAYLERQRDRVSPAEYAAEVLGEWSDAAGQLFPNELIEAQTAAIEAPSLAELISGAARPSMGLDWGVSFDRSAAAMIYRLPGVSKLNAGDDGRPKFLAIPHTWAQGVRLSTVVEQIHKVPAIFFNPETSGVGAGPAQLLQEKVRSLGQAQRRWNFVATTAAKKTAGYGTILGLAERGQLFWPADPDLLRQLRGLRFEQGDRGFTRIEAQDAVTHDDVADALMLATIPRSPRRGRVVCYLSLLADPRRAAPDMELPEDPSEPIEAGSGYRLYRRPALQSITGRELTLPSAAAATVPLHLDSPQLVEARERIAAARQQEEDTDAP